jgi:alpha-galactosidase
VSVSPRITIIGGGSYHWAPRLLADFCNTESLTSAHVVLHDLDPAAALRMGELGTQFARRRDIDMRVEAIADVGAALGDSDFVISAFSVGGLASMRHDIEVPERFGIRQPIGDSVGPGGISRALRGVPVVLEMARNAEAHAPNALFINVSNPLTALTRTIAKETSVSVVGLCNELVGLQFQLSLLFGVSMQDIDFVVGGINHFPVVTELRISGGADGFDRLRHAIDVEPPPGALWMQPPEAMHWRKVTTDPEFTKVDLLANLAVKLELFRRFGVLPGANDHHIVEFLPGFVHPDNDHGAAWQVRHWGIDGHAADVEHDIADYRAALAANDVTRMPSGELVANLLDGIVTGSARALPVNLANHGQVSTLPNDVVVECMGIADASGVRARDTTAIPGLIGEYVRRVSASQEFTVEAALTGDHDLALAAMLADPLAGRLPYDQVVALTGAMLDATAEWLPQFSIHSAR